VLGPADVQRIWFGCGNFGGIGSSPKLRDAGDSAATALELLDHARRVGLYRFDTANSYGGGASEIILGQWLRAQGAAFVRDAQIATKVGNPHGCPPGETPLSAAQIAHHLDVSLTRLGVERIDLYYVHEFDRVTPLEETLGALACATEAGKIDRFGISNASLADVRAVRELAGDSLGARFAYVQNEYNLLAAADAEELIPYCAGHGLRYTAFSPLAGGFLTGKYRTGEAPPPDSRAAHEEMGQPMALLMTDERIEAVDRLRPIAEQEGLTLVELALAWVLRRSELASAIVGASRPEQVHANAKASGIELSSETVAAIDQALGDVPIKDPLPAPFAKPGVTHRAAQR